jgi:hypothetical protein
MGHTLNKVSDTVAPAGRGCHGVQSGRPRACPLLNIRLSGFD